MIVNMNNVLFNDITNNEYHNIHFMVGNLYLALIWKWFNTKKKSHRDKKATCFSKNPSVWGGFSFSSWEKVRNERSEKKKKRSNKTCVKKNKKTQ